jgi:hypothetical protein
MSPEERAAFESAYANGVANHSREVVSTFLDDYLDDHDGNDLYNRHECYTSVVDALCVWGDAREFFRKENNAIDGLAAIERFVSKVEIEVVRVETFLRITA